MISFELLRKVRARIEKTHDSLGITPRVLKVTEDSENSELRFLLAPKKTGGKRVAMVYRLDENGNTIDAGIKP